MSPTDGAEGGTSVLLAEYDVSFANAETPSPLATLVPSFSPFYPHTPSPDPTPPDRHYHRVPFLGILLCAENSAIARHRNDG